MAKHDPVKVSSLVTFTKSAQAKAKLASASRTATAYVGLFRSWHTAYAHVFSRTIRTFWAQTVPCRIDPRGENSNKDCTVIGDWINSQDVNIVDRLARCCQKLVKGQLGVRRWTI